MIAIKTRDDGLVPRVQYQANTLADGWLEVEDVPEPEAREGFEALLRYDEERGLYYEYVQLPEPESAPEPEPPAPTRAEIEAARAAAYRATVDPITCEIARLRDMGGSAEEIAEAEARREAAVDAIKAQWPYPEGAE